MERYCFGKKRKKTVLASQKNSTASMEHIAFQMAEERWSVAVAANTIHDSVSL